MSALSTVFGSLERALVCLGEDFRVCEASSSLDRLAGDGAAEAIAGRPAEEVLGVLFEEGGALRRALNGGQMREGWGGTLDVGEGFQRRRVSVTAAPLRREPGSVCDPRVAFLVVLRPIEQHLEARTAAPTLFSGLIARSRAMLEIFRLVENLGESDPTVLITGESGTGKELVARAIHQHSHRRAGRFVAVNCGALPDQLLESELFGHVRGAFTGAVRDRIGRFELAAGGTLFLDEVGDVPLQLQVKLLRMLQERTFERVGESRTRSSDARIIAATNLDLRLATEEGRFREDLFYRLRVVPIEIPPLRRRREDVGPLAGLLLSRIGRRYGRALQLAPDAMRALLEHDWPGNVRELENALEYAMAICQGQTIHAADLPREVAETGPSVTGETRKAGPPPPGDEDPEAGSLRAALDAHQWRRDETARALGISRTTLWRRMRELGLSG